MPETILNIYLIIDKNFVTAFKCKSYQQEGTDEEKIKFLKEHAKEDFSTAFHFDAPQNKNSEFMSYKKFSKIETQGLQENCSKRYSESSVFPKTAYLCNSGG